MERLAELADLYPDWEKKLENEIQKEKKPAKPAKPKKKYEFAPGLVTRKDGFHL